MENYERLIQEGWKEESHFGKNSVILTKGEETILLDKITDEIFGSYSVKEKPAV